MGRAISRPRQRRAPSRQPPPRPRLPVEPARPAAPHGTFASPVHPIYFLIPTRNRPAKLRVSVDSFMRLASHPERVKALLFVDEDDTTDYSAYAHVKRGPRWGYAGLHCMMNELAAWAKEMDGAGPPGWQIMWNDDETMLTHGWDDRLLAYGEEPKVVFMRRDCTAAIDTAYPAWPRSFFDLIGRVGADSACDTWLALMTGAADRLIGRTATHIHALDVFVRHERDENDRSTPSNPAPMPDPLDCGIERDAFKLARAHNAPCFSPPFGEDKGTPIVR